MAEKLLPTKYPERLTRLGTAVSARLEETEVPIITNYTLFLEVRALYLSGKKLYLRRSDPTRTDYHRLRKNLLDANVITPDRNYRHRAYRVNANTDRAAEDICCLADSFCYVSQLSAMERYGLTNRRPKRLHISTPRGKTLKKLIQEKMDADYEEISRLSPDEVMPLQGITHPHHVRRQYLKVFHTVHPGKSIQMRGSYARIATIGQTFLDTLEDPGSCGGMAHVIAVWEEHARNYIDDIINAVDGAESKIAKVRAGYLLEEILEIQNERITCWKQYAQRGGSRVLDPSRPFEPRFSEDWMISINV